MSQPVNDIYGKKKLITKFKMHKRELQQQYFIQNNLIKYSEDAFDIIHKFYIVNTFMNHLKFF